MYKKIMLICFLFFIVFFFSINCRSEKRVMNSDEKKFYSLYKSWQEYSKKPEFFYSSDSSLVASGDAYNKIVEMGNSALPFVFKELKRGDSVLIYAAEAITGVKLNQKGENLQEQRILWLKWWKENKKFYIKVHE